MSETPNHGYNVPDEGEQDWHEPLNENFAQYDTDIEIRDSLSNRSNYDPVDGAKFFATDSGTVLLGDGSSWNPVTATGPVPTFEQLFLDGSVPLLQLRSDGDELAELMTETSGDAARLLLSLYDEDGGRNFVLSANRENNVGIGRSGADVPLDVRGRNNWNLDNGDGDVRIGDSDHRLAIGVALGGGGAGACNVRAKGGVERLNLGAGSSTVATIDGDSGGLGIGTTDPNRGLDVDHPDGARVAPPSGNTSVEIGELDLTLFGTSVTTALHASQTSSGEPAIVADGDFSLLTTGDALVAGNLDVSGNKNFVQSVDTDEGEKEVVYTAAEAGTPHTEVSGVAELEDGCVEVDLPEHFAWVTSDEEPLVVQVTPHASVPVRPQVTERSTDRIVVEDFADGSGNYEVSYTVTGTRAGYEDKEVVREPRAASSGATDSGASSAPQEAD